MNNPELDRLIKEKMQKYVPSRPVQVMHGGVIVLISIAVGILSLSGVQESHPEVKWLGVSLAVTGLILYIAWTFLRIDKARKEANAEFLAASSKKPKKK